MPIRNYRYFNKTAVTEAARLKKKGCQTAEIARRLKVSRQTIWRWLKLHAIKGPPKRQAKKEGIASKYDGHKRGRKVNSIVGLTEAQLNEIRKLMRTFLPSELNLPYQKPRYKMFKKRLLMDNRQKGKYYIWQWGDGKKFKKKEISVEKWYSATMKELVKTRYNAVLSTYQARKLLRLDCRHVFYRDPYSGIIEVV